MTEPVFELELPLEMAPCMNAYATMSVKKKSRLKRAIDSAIMIAKQTQPRWDMGVQRILSATIERGQIKQKTTLTGGRRRKIVMTRYSSVKPDEIAVDVAGGKLPVDRMVIAKILRDDSTEWLQREAHWVKCAPKQGRVVLQVFEAA